MESGPQTPAFPRPNPNPVFCVVIVIRIPLRTGRRGDLGANQSTL
jgi:hypothetical protein